MQKPMKMTLATLKALKDELEYRRTVERYEAEEEFRLARSYGNLSENAEYDLAKEWIMDIEHRIAELEAFIANAVIIEAPVDTETIVDDKNNR